MSIERNYYVLVIIDKFFIVFKKLAKLSLNEKRRCISFVWTDHEESFRMKF